MDDRLKERLQKLQRLAERGVGGEKETAIKKLNQLLAANELTEADLNDDKQEFYLFSYKYPYRYKLLGQIIYKVLGSQPYYRNKGTRNKIGVYCTAAQKVEIELDFEFYCRLLDQEIELLTSAFIAKQNLFPPDAPTSTLTRSSMTDEEFREYLKKKAYESNMEQRTRSLMIEGSDES